MKKQKTFSWSKGAWVARRRGRIYCAPACGRGCTFAEYKEALKRSRAVASRLGPGWKPVVHENMGWHYYVSSPGGFISVFENAHINERKSTYWVLANTTGDAGSGDPGFSPGKNYPTPMRAVQAVRVLMRKEMIALQKAMDDTP
jgi:hypothetical protein